jgi:hypothetical protein
MVRDHSELLGWEGNRICGLYPLHSCFKHRSHPPQPFELLLALGRTPQVTVLIWGWCHPAILMRAPGCVVQQDCLRTGCAALNGAIHAAWPPDTVDIMPGTGVDV